MPAPCKICGFVGPSQDMKQHAVDKHGANPSILCVRHANVRDIVILPKTPQKELDATNFHQDTYTRIVKYKTGKGRTNIPSARKRSY